MGLFILRRLLLSLVTVVVTVSAVFFLIRALPGDPAQALAGPDATLEQIEYVRAQWGLDQPVVVQMQRFYGNVLAGNLGTSLRTGRLVVAELLPAFSATFRLASGAMLLSVGVGVLLGILGAVAPRSGAAVLLTGVSLLGVSLPLFWWGLVLMHIFAVKLRLLPSAGAGSISHYVLPTATLALYGMAFIARITRTSMLDVLRQDYIRTAWAKGLTGTVVIGRHAFANVLVPVVTATGLQFGQLMAGAVLTETVFSWPGLGQLLVRSILSRDYPVVQGAVVLIAIFFALLNLVTDLIVHAISPTTR